MLSDHIVFWMKLNQMPVFPNRFEMLIYEMECSSRRISEEIAAAIRPAMIKAMASVFRAMAENIERGTKLT